ncbi:MAG: hypothetical protein Q7S79_00845 [bacterium]|nr:hypothetical protein [bacterium]
MPAERAQHRQRIGDGIILVWRDVPAPTPKPDVRTETQGSIFPRLAYMIGRPQQESSSVIADAERQQIEVARRAKREWKRGR